MPVSAGPAAYLPVFRGKIELLHDYSPGVPPAQQVYTVPLNECWLIYNYSMQLDTSVLVANRIMAVEWADSAGNRIHKVQSAVNMTAGATWEFNMFPNAPAYETQVNNLITLSVPLLFMLGGGTISTNIANLQVGDSYHGFTLDYSKWKI